MQAYRYGEGKKIDGRKIVVDFERGRTALKWRPRRLGVLDLINLTREVLVRQGDVSQLRSRRTLWMMVMIRRKPDLEVVVREVIRKKEAIEGEVHLY